MRGGCSFGRRPRARRGTASVRGERTHRHAARVAGLRSAPLSRRLRSGLRRVRAAALPRVRRAGVAGAFACEGGRWRGAGCANVQCWQPAVCRQAQATGAGGSARTSTRRLWLDCGVPPGPGGRGGCALAGGSLALAQRPVCGGCLELVSVIATPVGRRAPGVRREYCWRPALRPYGALLPGVRSGAPPRSPGGQSPQGPSDRGDGVGALICGLGRRSSWGAPPSPCVWG